jgi:NADPH:quinone reductase-like Zn-dependent oxidoreductase
MEYMNAAVVTSFDEPPHYQKWDAPISSTSHEEVVKVLAVGLHPRVRSGASGAHYTSSGRLPMIPGVDAVGERSNGKRIYFVVDDNVMGTMAEQAIVDFRRAVDLPDNVNVEKIAAAMNPAMSAWIALRRRVPIVRGQSVLVLGATGNAGSMAVQVAKRLGASRVVGAGRDAVRLSALATMGVDAIVPLTDDADATATALGAVAANVDIVLDYLWGAPAQDAMTTLLTQREDRSHELNWIQIGAVAGPTIELPSVLLRSTNFRLLGNGQGAVSATAYRAELPSLVEEIDAGTLNINVRIEPLAAVEVVWRERASSNARLVFVP